MVIQRWQSVLLLIAVIMMALFSFMSLGQLQTDMYTFNFTALGFSVEGEYPAELKPEGISTWYFFAVSLLTAILPLIAIFCYRNYKLQCRLCLIECLLLACVCIIGASLAYTVVDGAEVQWSSLVCAPFISLITVIMAYNRIVADRRAIDSINRIR